MMVQSLKTNLYLWKQGSPLNVMLKKLKELYSEYKEYVRVDLLMYAVMILLIILYVIISLFT